MGKGGIPAFINHPCCKTMKKIILSLIAAGLSGTALLHAADAVKLDQPDLERGAPVMKALSDRQSIRSFSEKMLSQKDLSDLLWAANGVNRPESGKRTAPSAMNRQDVKNLRMHQGSLLPLRP